MKPLLSFPAPTTVEAVPFFVSAKWTPPVLRRHRRHRRLRFTPLSFPSKLPLAVRLCVQNRSYELPEQMHRPRKTLFPGGYKRPEINVPGLLLRLDADELLNGGRGALDLIDRAVAKFVGVVVLNGGAGGGRLYEAACVLKSVVKGRAYLLIAERVDIATAIGASGVVLSDEGLPAIVARNTMMNSNSESVVLPLVAKIVQDFNSASKASSSEGADFLIFGSGKDKNAELAMNSLFKSVKIPIFVTFYSNRNVETLTEGTRLLKLGAVGFVISLEDLRSSRDDVLCQLFDPAYALNSETQTEVDRHKLFDVDNDMPGKRGFSGFIKMEDREKKIIETEKSVLSSAIKVIKKAAPLMEELSLLMDAVSRIDEPFLLVIVGEFNSGKSTVINALLGKRYLNEGVVPTTNEITFLCYDELESKEQQRCQRHPDGRYIRYLPAPILKDINIVDTPGTNVILQRQQRLTEEFVPHADLLLFVLSADRPLTESEVIFLRYTQQWKKKSVFVLNKSDIYRDVHELEEAISFIKENTQKLLNTENVTLYPVSARSALEAKLSASSIVGRHYVDADSHWRTQSFHDLENFLYSFLDGTTTNGMERIKLKLETPVAIAERLLSTADSLVRQDCLSAQQDLNSAKRIIDRINEYAIEMENESISWRRQALSLIDATTLRVVELIESTLQLSNLDLVASYVLKRDNLAIVAATSRIQSEILAPALSDAQKLLGEYKTWLQSNNAREGRQSKESFENKWPALVNTKTQLQMDAYDLLRKADEFSLKVIQNMSAATMSRILEQEIREVFVGTFGGLGAAGLSASLLTSVLPTTLEDLLALGLCSAGGYIAIANFPYRRQAIVDKVNKTADLLAQQLEDAMQKDLIATISNLENFVRIIARPYQEEVQERLDHLLGIQNELSDVKSKLQILQVEIQNLHVSRD